MALIQKKIDRWKNQGVQLILEEHQKIRILAPTDIVKKIGAEIKEQKPDLIQYISNKYEEEYEERVAIISWEGRIPKAFAEASARVLVYPRPLSIPIPLWEKIRLNASHLVAVDHEVQELISYEWAPWHFFKCHKINPMAYPHLQGIVFQIYGMNFTGIDYHRFKCRDVHMKEFAFKKPLHLDIQETTIMNLQQAYFTKEVQTDESIH